MKKILLIIALAFPVLVNAQFKLTPVGFLSSADSTKNFIVVEVPALFSLIYTKNL